MPPFLPFAGKIPVSGLASIETSAFAETSWSNDTPTLPAQNPAAFSETGWTGDTDDAEEEVFAFELVEDNWA